MGDVYPKPICVTQTKIAKTVQMRWNVNQVRKFGPHLHNGAIALIKFRYCKKAKTFDKISPFKKKILRAHSLYEAPFDQILILSQKLIQHLMADFVFTILIGMESEDLNQCSSYFPGEPIPGLDDAIKMKSQINKTTEYLWKNEYLTYK